MSNLIKAFWYLRVSSDGQVKYGNWLNGQRWAIEQFADFGGFYIEHFYIDDGVSWKLASRKWLDEMLKDLKAANKNPLNPTIKHIIVDDIDRIARDVGVWITKKAEIEATWATILSLKQTLEDTPEGRLSATITMATKQYERENNSRRVISRQIQRLKDWYRCFYVPLGYKYEKAKQWWWKVVVPDEPTFSIVSEWFKLLASWVIPNQEWLCNYFNERWVIAKRWGKITKQTINHLLHPDILYFYAWLLNCPKRGLTMIKWRHQAAITESEFYQICNAFKIKWYYKDYRKDDITEQLPLRSVLRCEHCWARLSWSSTRWNWWRYFYYYCWSQKCPYYRKSIKCDTVHHSIETLLKEMTLDDEYLENVKAVFDLLANDDSEEIDKEVSEMNVQISDIDAKINELVNKITLVNSDIVIKRLGQEIEKLENEKQLLKWEMIKKNEVSNTPTVDFEQLKEVIKSPLSIWNMWDVALKKLLINTLFWGKMTYSIEHGIQTTEFPITYMDKCLGVNLLNSSLYGSTQTNQIPGLLLYHWATLAYGGRGWTRTIDLTLIRGAL